MAESSEITRNFTINDIEVGSRLYEALVNHAKETAGAPIFYGDLLALARSLHPHDEVVKRAVPVGIGMKLLFVETFCRSNAYPNLACLAVNRATGRPGPGYLGDWEADKRAVAAFDWSSADAVLLAYASAARAALPKAPARRKEELCLRLWWTYYDANRTGFPAVSQDDKQEIINRMMEGMEPEAARDLVLAAKAEFGEPS